MEKSGTCQISRRNLQAEFRFGRMEESFSEKEVFSRDLNEGPQR
jgi:hypothetical protein